MKSLKQSVVVTFFAVLACAGLRAQNVDLRATIPFDFHAGDRLIPAGEYVIEGRGPAIFLRVADSGTSVAALLTNNTIARNSSRPARLDFNCYGSEYYLRAI